MVQHDKKGTFYMKCRKWFQFGLHNRICQKFVMATISQLCTSFYLRFNILTMKYILDISLFDVFGWNCGFRFRFDPPEYFHQKGLILLLRVPSFLQHSIWFLEPYNHTMYVKWNFSTFCSLSGSTAYTVNKYRRFIGRLYVNHM